MNRRTFSSRSSLSLAFYCAVLFPAVVCAVAVSAAEPTTARARTPDPKPVPAPVKPVEAPKSIFEIPASSAEGRNPFFPEKTTPRLERTVTPVVVPASNTLVLNGITSPPRRTAMINGRTFDVGEKADMKIGNGPKVPVTCIEIHDDSVLIDVNGQTKVLKLRSGL